MRYGSSVKASKGDYVFYRISAKVAHGSAGHYYTLPARQLFDYFDGSVYEYVDFSDGSVKQGMEDILQSHYQAGQLTDTEYNALEKYYNGSGIPMEAWNDSTAALPQSIRTELTKNGDLCIFTNSVEISVLRFTTVYMYVCLKVKDLDESKSWLNNAKMIYSNREYNANIGVSKDSFYDAAIQIEPASIFRGSLPDDKVIHIGNSNSYPTVLTNSAAGVIAGDLLTFKISGYGKQGTETGLISKISIYVPPGLEMIESKSELPKQFDYGKNSYDSQYSEANYGHYHAYPNARKETVRFIDHGQYHGSGLGSLAELYQIERYEYDFPVKVEAAPVIYVTCRVKSLEPILDAYPDFTANEAAKFWYMMSAEISEIKDASGSTVVSAQDEDSWIDTDPFNDWFYEAGSSYELKSDSLIYNAADSKGEMDQRTTNHLYSRTGKYPSVNVKGDEDDFDFALVYPMDMDSSGLDVVEKDASVEYGTLIASKLAELGAENDETYELMTEDGKIGHVGTVVPYIVYINKYGAEKLEQVTFKDKLPDSMKFLTSQGEPVFYVVENIETDGIRYPSSSSSSGSIISNSQMVTVKDGFSPAYLQGENCFVPSAITGGEWQYTYGNNTLSVEFGDIDDNSFAVIYFGVVDKLTASYVNTATVTWLGGKTEVEDSVIFVDKANNAIVQGKVVSVNGIDGPWGTDFSLENTEDVTLHYRLRIAIATEGGLGYSPGELWFGDELYDPFDGQGAEVVPVFDKITENTKDPAGPEYEVEVTLDESPFDIQENAGQLSVINDQQIDEAVDTYVYFHVTYPKLPAGISVDNLFGVTTQVKTPMALTVVKVDAEDTEMRLAGAGFDLCYTSTGDSAVMDLSQHPVVRYTDSAGTLDCIFHIDDTKITKFQENGQTYFYLYLRETRCPDGYLSLDVAYLRLKVRTDGDGGYQFMSIVPCDQSGALLEGNDYEDYAVVDAGTDDMSGIGSGAISLQIKNYKGIVLPATGGGGTASFPVIGAVFMGAAMLMNHFSGRRRRVRRKLR